MLVILPDHGIYFPALPGFSVEFAAEIEIGF